jgi:hypothetical protein
MAPVFLTTQNPHRGDRPAAGSAFVAATAATPAMIAWLRLKTGRAVRFPLDAYHWEDNHGGGLCFGIDISADAGAARLVGKLDDFAHCSPLSFSAQNPPDPRLPTIKGVARLTLC